MSRIKEIKKSRPKMSLGDKAVIGLRPQTEDHRLIDYIELRAGLSAITQAVNRNTEKTSKRQTDISADLKGIRDRVGSEIGGLARAIDAFGETVKEEVRAEVQDIVPEVQEIVQSEMSAMMGVFLQKITDSVLEGFIAAEARPDPQVLDSVSPSLQAQEQAAVITSAALEAAEAIQNEARNTREAANRLRDEAQSLRDEADSLVESARQTAESTLKEAKREAQALVHAAQQDRQESAALRAATQASSSRAATEIAQTPLELTLFKALKSFALEHGDRILSRAEDASMEERIDALETVFRRLSFYDVPPICENQGTGGLTP